MIKSSSSFSKKLVKTRLEPREITTTETIMVEIEYIDTEYSYIEGEIVEQPIKLNNSWTISYSLKNRNWLDYMLQVYILGFVFLRRI